MPKDSPFAEQLENVQESNQTTSDSSDERLKLSREEKDDDTRQQVAKKFVRYYFELLTLIIVGIPIYNILVFRLTGSSELTIPFKDAILTYSAVVGPTVGLVVAYYFESKNKSN